MNKIRNMENVWSHLPSDLLLLISETLNIPDLISFSSVCTSWQLVAATSKHRGHIRHQSPWLMLVGKDAPNSAQLYSFSNNKVYTIPNQPGSPIANRIFIGSAHGWLVTADEKSELSLLNPVTREQIDLPPASTFENVHRVSDNNFTDNSRRDEYGFITHFTSENLRYLLYDKATVSSSPASGDYTVVLLLYSPYGFALARAGDKKWTMMDHSMIIYDLAFHDNGKMYTTDWSSTVVEWDFNMKDLSLVYHWPVFTKERKLDESYFSFYLVRAPWGDLLLVRRDKGERDLENDDRVRATRGVEIWKVEFDGGSEKFIELKSLGDYALFLGSNISTCVSCKDNPELRANCVYLTDDWFRKSQSPDVCIVNLEDGSIERILPNDLRMIWRLPIWITPSLA